MSGSSSLVKRHRRKIIVSSTLLAAIFATCSVAVYLGKRWLYKQQLKLSEQRFVKEQIKRRFVQTQQDSLYTIYELLPVMTLVMSKDFDLDSIVESLKGKKLQKKLSKRDSASQLGEENLSSGMSAMTPASAVLGTQSPKEVPGESPKSKADLWNELKLKAISKVVIVAYTISLLTLLTRLQLNILARREYLDTAINVALEKEKEKKANQFWFTSWVSTWLDNKIKSISPEEEKTTDSLETESVISSVNPEKNRYVNEQAFLSLSWWLLNRGYLHYKTIIEQLVREEFQSLNPRDPITLEEFSSKLSKIFVATNKQFFKQPQSSEIFLNCLLPEQNLERFVLQQTLEQDALKVLYEDNTLLKQLIQETNKCLQSSGTWIVLEHLIDETFQSIMEQVETNVNSKLKPTEADEPVRAFQVALYAVAFKDCSSDMLKAGLVSMNNQFLQKLHTIPALDDLSACVYSNFGL